MYGDECSRSSDIDQVQREVSDLGYDIRRAQENLEMEVRNLKEQIASLKIEIQGLQEQLGDLSTTDCDY